MASYIGKYLLVLRRKTNMIGSEINTISSKKEYEDGFYSRGKGIR